MRLQTLFENKNEDMPKRRLGKTGYDVSLFALGGQGSLESQGNEKNCIEIIQRAYELGVNYFDTSPIYDDSELYYGKALKNFRNKIFLATKTDKRDRDGSLREIEKSLKRLKTDYIDLWQIHHLKNIDEVNKVTNKNGALQALIEMQEQGVVKHLGITSHTHPSTLQEAAKRHPFDTILCPINSGDKSMKDSFINTIVQEANQKNMGIIGMKVFSQGYIFHPQGIVTTWEPISYALSQPVSTIIVGIDTLEQLEENISVVKNFRKLLPKELRKIEEKTKPYIKRACFFRREFGDYDSREKLDDPYIINNYGINN